MLSICIGQWTKLIFWILTSSSFGCDVATSGSHFAQCCRPFGESVLEQEVEITWNHSVRKTTSKNDLAWPDEERTRRIPCRGWVSCARIQHIVLGFPAWGVGVWGTFFLTTIFWHSFGLFLKIVAVLSLFDGRWIMVMGRWMQLWSQQLWWITCDKRCEAVPMAMSSALGIPATKWRCWYGIFWLKW